MLDRSEGKIYLASQRACAETDSFRSFNTFLPVEASQAAGNESFGPLYLWSDDTLAGGASLAFTTSHAAELLLLPVVGAARYHDDRGTDCLVVAGEIQRLFVAKGTRLEIGNPFENELVNIIQVWLKVQPHTLPVVECCPFDIDNSRNRLVGLFSVGGTYRACWRASIGKFSGRSDCSYAIGERNGVFAFVLQGAFEVQYRLLEARDGLAIWNTKQIELEALSEEAIIFILEIPAAA